MMPLQTLLDIGDRKKVVRRNMLVIKENENRKSFLANKLLKASKIVLGNKMDDSMDDELKIKDDDQLKLIFDIFSAKENKKKNMLDNKLVVNYLQTMHGFVDMLKAVFNNEKALVTELLTNISFFLNYEKLESNTILFRLGDRGEKFYIILKGAVEILIAKERRITTTEIEYLHYLTVLKKFNESELLSRCLQLNKYSYSIEMEDEPHHDRKSKIKHQSKLKTATASSRKASVSPRRMSINQVEEMINKLSVLDDSRRESKVDPQGSNNGAFTFCKSNITSEEYINRLKVLTELKEEDMINITKANTHSEHKIRILSLVIFEYHLIATLQTGQTFGEVALENPNSKRSATIIVKEESHFGLLDKESYVKCIKEVNDKAKKAALNFIISNEIFLEVNKLTFEKKYYNEFVLLKIPRGHKLLHENEPIDSLYFIREGVYDVYLHKSIFELTQVIHEWDRISCKDPYFGKGEMYRCLSEPEFKKFYYQKNKIRVFIINGKELMGLEDFFIENKSTFTVECTSVRGDIFQLKTKFFESMCQNIKYVKETRDNIKLVKKKMLLEKLIKVREIKLSYFSKKNESSSLLGKILRAPSANAEEKLKQYKIVLSKDKLSCESSRNKKEALTTRSEFNTLSYDTRRSVFKPLDLKMESIIKHKSIDRENTENTENKIELKIASLDSINYEFSQRENNKENILLEENNENTLRKLNEYNVVSYSPKSRVSFKKDENKRSMRINSPNRTQNFAITTNSITKAFADRIPNLKQKISNMKQMRSRSMHQQEIHKRVFLYHHSRNVKNSKYNFNTNSSFNTNTNGNANSKTNTNFPPDKKYNTCLSPTSKSLSSFNAFLSPSRKQTNFTSITSNPKHIRNPPKITFSLSEYYLQPTEIDNIPIPIPIPCPIQVINTYNESRLLKSEVKMSKIVRTLRNDRARLIFDGSKMQSVRQIRYNDGENKKIDNSADKKANNLNNYNNRNNSNYQTDKIMKMTKTQNNLFKSTNQNKTHDYYI